MPLYEDLVRRALEARAYSEDAVVEARRLSTLSQLLRDARAGSVMIVRCAWCDSIQLGDEWLHLDAIGSGQRLITEDVRAHASHGICPTCLATQMQASGQQRAAHSR